MGSKLGLHNERPANNCLSHCTTMNSLYHRRLLRLVSPIILSMHIITFQILGYSDDIVLMGRTTGMLKQAMANFNNAAKKKGLSINIQKSHIWK
jgi:Reverse transcriptase (RNA-dependent DNA polymerase).